MNPIGSAVRRLGRVPWFIAAAKRLVWMDTALLRRTGGRFTLTSMAGADGLLLITTGRRTGQPRSVPLLYVTVSGGYVVAGSNWGGADHPAWSANLLANSTATVAVAGRTEQVTARLVDGQERARLWQALTESWPAYDSYAARAGRDIRVFVLAPARD
ncbi:MAG TPA: nitroreductase/quinone reductase family protein [Pseudonocardiaceae bacterium]|nr:nitroreductase/quinone reductase family protein [Pseudonocardiaceae bacterium]